MHVVADVEIRIPRETPNDLLVKLTEWLIADGTAVEPGTAVALLETTKAAFEVEAPAAGFLFHLHAPGDRIETGAVLAVISQSGRRPAAGPVVAAPAGALRPERVVTKRARELMQRHGIVEADLPGEDVVRESDVQAVVESRGGAPPPPAPAFAGERLDPGADWDAVLGLASHAELGALLLALRRRMRARWNRHVPTGDLLHDRWELARELGFGEGSSIYDSALVLGAPRIGAHCWIGPFTVIDAAHAPLTVGDHTHVGSGAHLYTHHTIEQALSGGRAPVAAAETRIGACCFIAPEAIIGPGTVLGDHCFVAAGSYLEGIFPDRSSIAGNPARIVGSVEMQDGRVRLRRYPPGA